MHLGGPDEARNRGRLNAAGSDREDVRQLRDGAEVGEIAHRIHPGTGAQNGVPAKQRRGGKKDGAVISCRPKQP